MFLPPSLNAQSFEPQQSSCVVCAASRILGLGHSVHVHPSADHTAMHSSWLLILCLVEIVPFDFPARAVHVQSPAHGVHILPKVLVWTPETLRASQSERDTSVPCCLYLSEDSNALAYISGGSQNARRTTIDVYVYECLYIPTLATYNRKLHKWWFLRSPTT